MEIHVAVKKITEIIEVQCTAYLVPVRMISDSYLTRFICPRHSKKDNACNKERFNPRQPSKEVRTPHLPP